MEASSKVKLTKSTNPTGFVADANGGLETVVNNYATILANRANKQNDTSTPELELRFGKEFPPRSSITINKSHFDNVIQWLLSTGFTTDGESTYLLRVNPILTARLVEIGKLGMAADDNIRLEVEGFSPIQDYCNNEDIVQLTKQAMHRAAGLTSQETATTAATSDHDAVSMTHVKSFMRFVRKTRRFRGDEASETATTMTTGTAKTSAPSAQINVHRIQKFNCKLSLALEHPLTDDDQIVHELMHEWPTFPKTYRHIHRMSYRKPGLPFRVDLSVVRQTSYDERKYNMRDSALVNKPKLYEIEVEFDNEECTRKTPDEIRRAITQAIKTISCGVQSSLYPIPYSEHFTVMEQYMHLIFGDGSRYRAGHSVSTRLFIAPGMVSLQMENIINNKDILESHISILKNYSVTDKVDGLHKMMLIARDLRIYLIDTNMQVQFTGLHTKEKRLANTLLDGEHVLFDKKSKHLNRFMAFDVYYINGVDVRAFPLYGNIPLGPIANAGPEILMEETDIRSRIFYMRKIIEMLNAESVVKSGSSASAMTIQIKHYEIATSERNIFECTRKVLDEIHTLEYETDGVIYTPLLLGVGAIKVDDTRKINKKASWSHMFKWKPLKDLTNDFLVTTMKNPHTNEDAIQTLLVKDGGTKGSLDSFEQYKTLELRVGYNPDRDGYMNPYQMVIDDDIPNRATSNGETTGDNYQPAKFYPDNPYDATAHICNVMLQNDTNGTPQMRSEDGELIEDGIIVECRYNSSNKDGWKWEIIRVRHDKTAEYLGGEKQYGNSFQTANSNWRIIHRPITERMITTGAGIPTQLNDTDNSIYYVNVQTDTKTERLGHFHNRYVKSSLIQAVTKPGQILIDFSVGKGGDLYKWKKARLSFVLGLDVHKDGITNRMFGACKRYLDDMSKIEPHFRDKTLQCLFVHADTSKSIIGGESTFDEHSENVLGCVFGEKSREFYQNIPKIGRGVIKQYGKLIERADVGSMQFALHYMFETKEKLTGFIRNVSDCIRKGGFLIGTCFDGSLIFDLLKDKKPGESHTLQEDGKKIWSVTRQYDESHVAFNNDDSCIGMAIDVFQDTIGQTMREYLVNFDYLRDIMELFGFMPLQPDDLESMSLSHSDANFERLFENMINETRRNPKLRSNYGNAHNMTKNERLISFSNRYFIFKKTKSISSANVAVASAAPSTTSESDDTTEPNDSKKRRQYTVKSKPNLKSKPKP